MMEAVAMLAVVLVVGHKPSLAAWIIGPGLWYAVAIFAAVLGWITWNDVRRGRL